MTLREGKGAAAYRLGILWAVLFLCWVAGGRVDAAETPSPCLRSFFTKSLHFTGEGMRYWYEEAGGFMQITGIPYRDLDCKNCHVESCDQCHAKKRGEKLAFSESKAKDMNTCLPCHSREGLTFRFDGERDKLDVHVSSGMVCADCHYRTDVHGDGRPRTSMRDPKAVRATCGECHIDQERDAPYFDDQSVSHTVHQGKLDCAACHVQDTMACLNCHFDTFLKTGERAGNFIPVKDWVILMNYDGRVTSASAMTLVHESRKFVAYAPYFTHSITPAGRSCEQCHNNESVRKMLAGETIQVLDFKDGRAASWKGVIPLIENRLQWVFLDKKDDGWEPIKGGEAPLVQYGGYGSPLTDEQLRKLAVKQAKDAIQP